ncbi:MAG: transporter [Bacteroidales bacterium]
MHSILHYLFKWRLPLAMLVGVILTPLMVQLSSLMKPLLFGMLFLTFLKIDWKDLKMGELHWLILACQALLPLIVYFAVLPFNKIVAMSIMVCAITPVATSSAVITKKIGGSAAKLSSFTMISNLLTAIEVSIFFPLIVKDVNVSFWVPFRLIFTNLFILLILPFLLSMLIKRISPKFHKSIRHYSGWSFYLLLISLAIVSGVTYDALIHSTGSSYTIIYMIIGSLLICLLQFVIGKSVGSIFNDSIDGGQMLGQKNTILAIWMAQIFLDSPKGTGAIIALGAGAYVLWQNLINGVQLAHYSAKILAYKNSRK